MAEYHKLTENQVQEITQVVAPQILESPATLRFEQLAKYGIRTITGLEFQQLQYRTRRRAGNTRPYKHGVNKAGILLDVDQVELTVKVCRGHYEDNVENYREKEPFHVLAERNFEDVESARKVLAAGQSATEDIIANIYYGVRDETVVGEGDEKTVGQYGVLSNFDGIFKKISDLKADGKKIHVIETGEFVPVTSSTKDANWNTFTSFIEQLPASFQKVINAENDPQSATVRVSCSPATYARILNSYAQTYPALTPDKVSKVEVAFMDFPNVILVSNPLIGKGSLLMAVIDVKTDPQLDFGVDSLNNVNHVEVNKNPFDPSVYMYDIKVAAGCRVMDETRIAFNDCENEFTASDYIGDAEMTEGDDCTMTFSVENGIAKKQATPAPVPPVQGEGA